VGRTTQPKPDVVVAVVGIVPVALEDARILWIVVPGAAAQRPEPEIGAPCWQASRSNIAEKSRATPLRGVQ